MNVPVPPAHAHAHAHALASAILDTERASAKLDMNVLVPPAHAHAHARASAILDPNVPVPFLPSPGCVDLF
jgi:hypothetical protein